MPNAATHVITVRVYGLDAVFAIVSEFAARTVKVALSGDGGDELFGGYTSLQQVQRFGRLDRVPQSLRLLMSWISARLPYSAYGKNFLHMIGRRNGLDRYFASNYSPYHMRSKLLRPAWMMTAKTMTCLPAPRRVVEPRNHGQVLGIDAPDSRRDAPAAHPIHIVGAAFLL